MREPRWVPRIVVETVHFDQVQRHGGLPGIRDEAALESALARPRNRFAYGNKPDPARLAAAYAYGLARDHPFQDGNKRIAFLTAVVFLGLNGYDLEVSDEDVIAHMLALAAGKLTETQVAAWIRQWMRPTPAGAAYRIALSCGGTNKIALWTRAPASASARSITPPAAPTPVRPHDRRTRVAER